jgi:RsiW-degrading membrane proteinase PrsW (M82 family)
VDSSTRILAALSGAVPALVAMLVFDFIDRKRPEPRSLRWKVAFAGMFSVVPVIFIDFALLKATKGQVPASYTYNGAMFEAYVIAAAVEELLKIAMIYWIVWRRPEFDERIDGIVYGARAGLGFALVENCLYLYRQPDLDAVLRVGILRAVLAVPGHAMWSAIIGYCAARRRFDHAGIGFLGGYLIAVAAHGTYDYAIFATVPAQLEGDSRANLLLIIPPAIIVACIVLVRIWAKRAVSLDDADHARAGIPPPPPTTAPVAPPRL